MHANMSITDRMPCGHKLVITGKWPDLTAEILKQDVSPGQLTHRLFTDHGDQRSGMIPDSELRLVITERTSLARYTVDHHHQLIDDH